MEVCHWKKIDELPYVNESRVDTHKNLQSIIQEDGELRVRETAYLNKIEQLSEKIEILYYKALFKKLRSSEEGNSLVCRRLKSCQ